MRLTNPHGKYVFANGEELYFSDAERAQNGWWRVGAVSTGRAQEGEDEAKRFLIKETNRLLEKADWPLPAAVGRKYSTTLRHDQFGLEFRTVFGAVKAGLNLTSRYGEPNIEVNMPPGVAWHLEKTVDRDNWHGRRVSMPFNKTELENYLGDPLKYLNYVVPGLDQFYPDHTGINFREEFEKTGSRKLGNNYVMMVGAQDLMHLRGEYIKMAKPAMDALNQLFGALAAVGIQARLQTSYSNGYRQVEGISVRIPEEIAINRAGGEFHSEPHEFTIGLSGVTVWCGYAANTKKMEDYQKLLAAQELAGLADLFTDGPEETVENSRTIEF